MSPLNIDVIPIYQDNYVWCLLTETETWVVDPGDHKPVLDYLERTGRTLSGILITHHHWDHVTGIVSLVKAANPHAPVIGPSFEIAGVTRLAKEGDQINIGAYQILVWETPGHTRDHLSYYLPQPGYLFCGDTLFAAGCGRLFDGTMEQLYASLQRIASLPPQTQIYCTHEYTLANLDFALAVEPSSQALKQRQQYSIQLRQNGTPTIPVDLGTELATNPFLRIREQSVQQAVKKAANLQESDYFLIFSELRKWKNRY